jgi:hypothetical protein
MKLHGILLLAAMVASLPAQPAPTPISIPATTNLLAQLSPEHPRLLVSRQDWVRLKGEIDTKQLKEWHTKLHARAERILVEGPSRYEIQDGLRLLSTSRRVVDRVEKGSRTNVDSELGTGKRTAMG